MRENLEGYWTWGKVGDSESYHGQYAHEWEAHAAAKADISPVQFGPITYEVAQLTHPINLVSDNLIGRHVERLLESIDESCHYEVGGDDIILELSGKDGQILVDYLRTFIKERAKVSRWGVINVKKHVLCGGVSTPVVEGE